MVHAYRPEPVFGVRDNLRTAWDVQPFSFTFSLVTVPVGLLAVLLGDRVSRAFSEIGEGVVSRFLGVLFLVGGSLALAGIVRRTSVFEALGLSALSAGAALYGTGVILGLGMSGMVAGPGYLAISVALARRVQILLALAEESGRDAEQIWVA